MMMRRALVAFALVLFSFGAESQVTNIAVNSGTGSAPSTTITIAASGNDRGVLVAVATPASGQTEDFDIATAGAKFGLYHKVSSVGSLDLTRSGGAPSVSGAAVGWDPASSGGGSALPKIMQQH